MPTAGNKAKRASRPKRSGTKPVRKKTAARSPVKPKPKAKVRPKIKAKTKAKPKARARARKPVVSSKAKAKATPPSKAPSKAKAKKAVRVIRSLLVAQGRAAAREAELFSELESLAEYIQSAKAEITALRPDEVKDEFLPTATDELDAIVGATAEATNAIMDAVEEVEAFAANGGGEAAKKLMNAATKIYEACGFQDITGQRIGKVVKTLKDIEEKVDQLLRAFGGEGVAGTVQPKKKKKPKDGPITDADLLEGPQLADKAKSQEEIDALLASFD